MNRILSLCFITFCLTCQAQQPDFQKIETVNGLASDKVFCMLQASNGHMWFGTDAGVSVFDGYTFKNYDNRIELTANEVFDIYQDSKDRLWFLSQNGEVSYHHNGALFTSKNLAALADLNINAHLTSIWEMANGNIALSSLTKGIYVLDSNLSALRYDVQSAYQVWTNKEGDLLALGLEGVYLLKEGKSTLIEAFRLDRHYAKTTVHGDTCFIGVGDRLYYYANKMEFVREFSDNIEITYLSMTDRGLEVGTRTGAYVPLVGADGEQDRVLDGSIISAIVHDNEGNLWISTVGDGVYFSSSPDTKIYTVESGLALNQVSRLHKDEDALWLGYRNGSYGIKKGTNVQNDPIATPTNEPVTQIKENSAGEHMVLSKSYITYIDSTNRKRYLRILVNDILFDTNYVYLASNRTYKITGSAFYDAMSTTRNVMGFLDQQFLNSAIVPHRTKVLCKDENGNLFFGTDRGLFIENEGITIDLGKITKGLNAFINDIVFDKSRGLTYVATRGEGILVLRGTSVVKRYTMAQNLSSNTCEAFDLDDQGQLWVGTTQGLDLIVDVSFDTAVTRFGANIGLRPTTIFDLVRSQNTIYMATNLGLMTYDLRTKRTLKTPNVPKIVGTYVNTKPVAILDSVMILNHDQNTVRFDFTTVTYKHIGQVNYVYTLEGYQNAWKSTKDRNIQFENLKPGTYTFKLKAAHMTGLISDPVQIAFVIKKPFWDLWWFRILTVLVGLAAIWLVARSRLRTWREKLTLENRLSEVKIDKLQLEKAYLIAEQKAGIMQMNPHFIFNSLNTIKGYYGQGKMKEANGFIGKFSKLLRKILESNKPLIPLQDEAEILTLYLELMRNRYDKVFDYEIINLVEDQLNAKIPPMILQPLVENAVIHGLAPINGGKISVSFELFENYLVCKVVDSGVGFSEELHGQHNSVALDNIRDRLDILSKQYNKPCSLKILSPINGGKTPGTAVIVKLPTNF
ncbi:MAG: ligand-binding sensor domain-containing protein [Bacteroidia bacterium]